MAKWLIPQTLDLEGCGSSLTSHFLSLDKELNSTLPFFCTQVYKMGTGEILLGITLQLASHPGVSSNTPRHASC